MDFTLDDIMAEFGSQAQQASAPEEEDVRVWTPGEKTAPVPEEPEEPEPEEPPAEEPEEEPAEEEPGEPEEPVRPRLFVLPGRKKPAEEEAELPPPEPPTVEEAAEHYRRLRRSRRPLAIGAWLTLLVSLAVALLSGSGWEFASAFTPKLVNLVTLGALLLHCLLALPVLTAGVKCLLERKFTLQTFLTVTVLVTLVHGFTAMTSGALHYCVAASLLLTVGIWSENLAVSAKYRTLAVCLRMEDPKAALRYCGLRQEQDGLCRGRGSMEGVTAMLESRPQTDKLLNAVAACLLAVTLVVAGILAIRGGENFLRIWTILLLGACPLGGFLSYARTFGLASRSLKSCSGALLGWEGAGVLDGEVCVAVGDEDLFPASHVSLDGVKVFGTRSAEYLMDCAAALLRRGGVNVLQKILTESPESGRSDLRTGDFRVYEGGGLGGEIRGDVVLLGSLRFMELMNVSLPEETRLKQALYISVNGAAEGVFAVRYHPSDAARSGLGLLLSQKKISTVLATRDMLLTPSLVRSAYLLDADLLEYPPVHERMALAEGGEGPGRQGALLGRDSFLAFCACVCVGRQLRRSVVRAAAVAIFAAILGCFLMTVFVLSGAAEAANALRLVAYHALWLPPTLLITGRIRQ